MDSQPNLLPRLVRIEERIEALEEKIDAQYDAVISHLDGISKNIQDLRTEQAANVAAITRFHDLEKRVLALESKPGKTHVFSQKH